MQKVVGSSPISRFESPANRHLSRARERVRCDAEGLGFESPEHRKGLQMGTFLHRALSRCTQKVSGSSRRRPVMKCLHLWAFGIRAIWQPWLRPPLRRWLTIG